MGGGALPEIPLDSVGLVFSLNIKPQKLAKAFRLCTPPIVGRIVEDHFVIDLLAVDFKDTDRLIKAVKSVIKNIK